MHTLTLGLVLTLLGASEAHAANPAANAEARLGTTLGVAVVDSLEARQAGFDGGVRVEGVEPRSAAARAGIRTGDVIVQLGGDPIRGVGDLADSLAGREADRPVAVKVLRNGREKVLTAQPTAAARQWEVRVPTVAEQVEVELADVLAEGHLTWSVPRGTLVAQLEDGHDFAIRLTGDEAEAQRLVIEVDGEIVFDSETHEGDLVLDLDWD